ncbi:MAG: ribosome maturation factor RimP, partial [Actinomycetota bacterium]
MADNAVILRVETLITPILLDLGLDLYDIDFGAGLLKITLDKPGGVDLEALSLATRLIRREFEHSDPVPGEYTLEVSSPGLERPLRRPEHFRAAMGAIISVRLRDVTNQARRVQGTLVAVDGMGIRVRSDEPPHIEHSIVFGQIDRARTVFEWGSSAKGARPASGPKAGKPAQRSGTRRVDTTSLDNFLETSAQLLENPAGATPSNDTSD